MRSILPLLLMFTLALLGCQPDPTAVDWSGDWESWYRDGQAQLSLEQAGDRVTGRTAPDDGRIEGTVEGPVLTGTWISDSGSEGFTFTLAPDGRTFMGRFDTGEWWNGGRDRRRGASFSADLASPQAVLRSIFIAGNEIRAGNFAYIPMALATLDLSSFPEEPDRAIQVELIEAILDVLDHLTIRLFLMPQSDTIGAKDGKSEIDEALGLNPRGLGWSLAAQQVGTDESIHLYFTRDHAGRWRLRPRTLDALREQAARLSAARWPDGLPSREELSLASPRATMRTFVENFARQDPAGRALTLSCLDLSQIDPVVRDSEAPLLAEYLKQVIDRAGFLIWQEQPDDPWAVDEFVYFEHPLGNLTLASHLPEGSAVPQWRFTPQTLAGIRTLYDAFEDLPLDEGVVLPPARLPFFRLRQRVRAVSPRLTRRLRALELWQWLAVVTGLAGGLLLGRAVGGLPGLMKGYARHTRERLATTVFWPLGLLLAGVLWYLLFPALGLPHDILAPLSRVSRLALAVACVWLAYSTVDGAGHRTLRAARHGGLFLDEIFVSLMMSSVKIGLVVAGLFLGAEIFSVPYRTVFAGLGIGGLAFAIAAQDTIANFFGSAVLLADRPFKRGDLVLVAGHEGRVENVGLRSTRIRTLDDSLVVIPNRLLVSETIDNLGARRSRRVTMRLGLLYSTAPTDLERFTEALRDLLRTAPYVLERDLYLGLWAFADSAIEVDLRCHLRANDLNEEYDARHRLVGAITALAAEVGVEFAFPTRTLEWAAGHALPDPAVRGATDRDAVDRDGDAVGRDGDAPPQEG